MKTTPMAISLRPRTILQHRPWRIAHLLAAEGAREAQRLVSTAATPRMARAVSSEITSWMRDRASRIAAAATPTTPAATATLEPRASRFVRAHANVKSAPARYR